MILTLTLCLLALCASLILLTVAPAPLNTGAQGALPSQDTSASVSVIIPARNEGHNLAPLLASLHAQSLALHDIIVVDDASTDDTAQVAQAADVQVLKATPIPCAQAAGRPLLGKPWACAQGAQLATGDLLVFLDADVRLAPQALAALCACHARHGGFITVQPFHETQRPYEQLSAFFNVVVLWSIPRHSGSSDKPSAKSRGAFGPVALCSRADYDRVGGHTTVASELLEHHALAAEFTKLGLPVHNYRGHRLIRFRMYPEGLSSWLTGWQKSFAKGAAATAPTRLLLIVLWIAGAASCPSSALAWCVHGHEVAQGISLYLLFAFSAWQGMRQAGRFHALTALCYPLFLVAFVIVFCLSVLRTHVLRRVTWKGRRITP